ncbi:TetR/AcrR family transcriptional regulator [Halalkalibacterium halodurans]|uniref:BH0317 protein n=2 Tax=Halalkalibacterium halodurans TaxID=86665 RepID=Q9KFZ9_HALH5|nr:TetR/AcrR family transcriptional regulator [Halalkalibacterium halodurans]MED4080023.1 TetR/AcrR family transcriptional regulator [Halalkalibacterium halodurans]MED4085553.1 TetR/AcrR family transcriptional regulator [Halalkalibacterium halodurans]MED4105564.1 TetR/AcrR family transcriptional regulator [Halalkalibacterium halodurans]MED4110343.1 TetR/AcrR family transcriptional regulator [Halalkalibacterium halodurans]MED4125526.1 TetR/AcrR family transcriptional regulator [Halalkalibacteri
MPPKKKFTKEDIIDSAFSIAKTEGIDKITIRKVADHLGSSSAPIYVNFEDVEELKHAVVQKIVQLSQQMIQKQKTGNPFRDIGLASLQMAKEYPVFVHDFMMKPNEYLQDYDEGMDLIQLMKQDPELEGFSEDELMTILLKMRAFQLGLTMMVANDLLPEDFTMENIIKLQDSLAEDVLTAARVRKEKDL